MAEPKTKKTNASVERFLKGIKDGKKREDSFKVLEIMGRITGEKPRMWGSSLVGFGSYRYRYASGREGEWFLTGFSPRKQALTLYIMSGFAGEESLMGKLGKFKTGKACLYLKSLDDVHLPTLERLIRKSVKRKASG